MVNTQERAVTVTVAIAIVLPGLGMEEGLIL